MNLFFNRDEYLNILNEEKNIEKSLRNTLNLIKSK
jgi:hypothetical protein